MQIVQRHMVRAAVVMAFVEVNGLVDPCAAQTIQANPQAQAALTPAVGQLPPTPPVGTPPSTVADTGALPGVNQTISRSKLSPPAGARLPGMRGGPPLYTPMGAGDPTAAFMRPLVMGPLSCDLVLDPACF
jgi:hypothetical protein